MRAVLSDAKRNRFGLTERDMKTITSILSNYSEVQKVDLFGSRAKGNYKLGSDIDLVVMNKGLSSKTLLNISRDFEESLLPYFVDIVSFHDITNQDFTDHIERVGTPFFEQSTLAELK